MTEPDQSRHYRQTLYDSYVSQKTRPGGLTHGEAEYRKWADAAHSRLAGWLPADRATPILDLGCGAGNFLYLLQQQGYTNLMGVDLSDEQLDLARQWCPNATLVQGAAQTVLAQQSGHFGLISGFDIIEHFGKEEILPVLELIVRALRPGGRLILQTPNAESPLAGAVVYGDFTHEWFFTPTSLADLLRVSGLTGYEARPSGPHVHGAASLLRAAIWRGVTWGLTLWNMAEVGHRGSGIYTRVFVATALKAA
jgi:2-polyprenyl-3-methyl-5-hydroxy-6-metoxy-1,4-benzoquinol methylase